MRARNLLSQPPHGARITFGNQDHIAGLEIAVNDSNAMSCAQSGADLLDQNQSVRRRQTTGGSKPFGKRLPLKQLHTDEYNLLRQNPL